MIVSYYIPNLLSVFYMQILIVTSNLFYIVRKFCEADTCENNGKCIEHVHGFRCVCPQGYKGKLCDGRYKCVPYRDSYTRHFFYSGVSSLNRNVQCYNGTNYIKHYRLLNVCKYTNYLLHNQSQDTLKDRLHTDTSAHRICS